VKKDSDAKFLEALSDCDSVEKLEALLAEQFGETDKMVMPRTITVTYQCSLCSGTRPTRQIVKATASIESHTLQVSICSLCEERLAEWKPAELARVLMNFMRFGKLRPEQVRWIRIGGDITSQMKELGLVRIPLIGEGELTYDFDPSEVGIKEEAINDSEDGGG